MEWFLYDRMYRPDSLQFSHLSSEKWQGCVISTNDFSFSTLACKRRFGPKRCAVQIQKKCSVLLFKLHELSFIIYKAILLSYVIGHNNKINVYLHL